MDRKGFLSCGGGVSERGRLLLLSDGSLVRLLEAIYMAPVHIEVSNQEEACITLPKDVKRVIKRGVWLKRGERRLIFAHSLISLDNLSERMRSRLVTGSHPLGLIIDEEVPCHRKEGLEIRRMVWPEKAIELGSPPDRALWMRRYRIVADKGLIALILEVFSPLLTDRYGHKA